MLSKKKLEKRERVTALAKRKTRGEGKGDRCLQRKIEEKERLTAVQEEN